tara:strand:+ start:164 stop:370 length:207 start_codon:yes stop_codon:yes gene_type:complete
MKILRLKIELITYGSEQGQFRGSLISQRGSSNVETPLNNDDCQNILSHIDEKIVSDKLEEKVIQSSLN